MMYSLRVESVTHDPNTVIIIHEGKHNHDVPNSRNIYHNTLTAWNSNHDNVEAGCQ